MSAHQKCLDAGQHVCHRPSGKRCHTQPCDEPAGTDWTPFWCPEHDRLRMDRISDNLNAMLGAPDKGGDTNG